jgi:hypothetical protein
VSARTKAEAFAKYHDEHAKHGGASQEFHERAASFLRGVAADHDELLSALSELYELGRQESIEDGELEAAQKAARAALRKAQGKL